MEGMGGCLSPLARRPRLGGLLQRGRAREHGAQVGAARGRHQDERGLERALPHLADVGRHVGGGGHGGREGRQHAKGGSAKEQEAAAAARPHGAARVGNVLEFLRPQRALQLIALVQRLHCKKARVRTLFIQAASKGELGTPLRIVVCPSNTV